MPGSISEAPTSRRPGSPFFTYRISNGRFLPAHDPVTGTPELLCGTNSYWLNFETNDRPSRCRGSEMSE